ncbi:heterokaryon incompatibility protein (HET) domain-containing protein [Sarocladium implicatum]|nr:heterokaryon incompatibility protein (HET) domain-containing protein [Sarocladium implicatum]
MFLLNIRTRRLESFINDSQIPAYYILSHVWAEDEVTYQDVRDCLPSALQHRRGWQKIVGFCEMLVASKHWLQSFNSFKRSVSYVWVDTCCINKESSAELSEAINSMYAWYSRAAACIAYLEDVPTTARRDLRRSRWFTRGWTLQELLAPDEVHFYTASWEHIGDRFSLERVICERTGIHPKFLERDEIWQASVAEKMSWASKRQTTRSEDIAYCLMGLFGINMPLLYGEGGENAFIRLQEEILKESTDESIFAWDANDDSNGAGMLATHPSRFIRGSSIIPLRTRKNPEAVKNGGMIMNTSCINISQRDFWNVLLDCTIEGSPENKRISIQVNKGPDCSRTPMPFTTTARPSEPKQLFFLKRRIAPPDSQDLHICEVSWSSESLVLLEAWPGRCWRESVQSTGAKATRSLEPLKPGQRPFGREIQSRYRLNVRRAWRMAADAGLTESGKLVAALAFRVTRSFGATIILGIMFTQPNEGNYVLSLMRVQGEPAPDDPQAFQHSYHWFLVANQLTNWATDKTPFDGSQNTALNVLPRIIAAQSSHRVIDRRNALVISLGDRFADDPSYRYQLNTEISAQIMVGLSLIRPENANSFADSEYWQPFHSHVSDMEELENTDDLGAQGVRASA